HKHRYVNTSTRKDARKSIVESSKTTEWSDLTPAEKAAGAAKATINLGIVALGVGVFGTLVYLLFSELFGANSSTKIFGEALEKIRANSECQKLLGTPIKGHGEPSSHPRQRRHRVGSQIVKDTNGTEHLLMKFYVEGPENEGIAILDMIKNQQGKWAYKYLIVDVAVSARGIRREQKIFVESNADGGNDIEKKK
ncbi:13820_t:CDS:2, partial [Ambispora leptoticha]